jgi:hypothetical protein
MCEFFGAAVGYSCIMKTFVPLILALAALPGHAQIYKWTDANGRIHYSDQPQDGVNAKELQVPHAPSGSASSNDDWRERDRISRDNQLRQAAVDRRVAAAQEMAKAQQTPFNPSANRSNTAMTDEELCRRDRQQIEYAEKTKHLAITHGYNGSTQLTEAQRQEVISERKTNHALTCGNRR